MVVLVGRPGQLTVTPPFACQVGRSFSGLEIVQNCTTLAPSPPTENMLGDVVFRHWTKITPHRLRWRRQPLGTPELPGGADRPQPPPLLH